MSKPPRDYIIFPLDVPDGAAARRYVGRLSGHVGMFKIGLELFVAEGPGIVRMIQEAGSAGVFLDLKLHDIPATVERAMGRIADLGAAFATVHCGENPRMLDAAVAGGRGRVGVLGVTLLTSVSSADLRAAGFRETFSADVSALVLQRARMARDAGCRGIVCSGLEVDMIRRNLPRSFIAVTPGIRPAWDQTDADDQQRVTTPAQAIRLGSDFVVIGRPIRDAADPRQAAARIAEEIGAALPGA